MTEHRGYDPRQTHLLGHLLHLKLVDLVGAHLVTAQNHL